MNWLKSFLTEYPQGKNLQRSGALTKEQLQEFFKKGHEVFDSSDFRQHLKECFNQKKSCQDAVNTMQMGIFESMGIQGDYGISFLGKVRGLYGDDPDMMQQFYQFVQREEQALDEAEMPEDEYKAKYAKLLAMAEQMRKHVDAIKDMTEDEKQKYMAKVYEDMVNQNVGAGACCSDNSCPMHKSVDEVALNKEEAANAVSQSEQLAFFQNLSKQQ